MNNKLENGFIPDVVKCGSEFERQVLTIDRYLREDPRYEIVQYYPVFDAMDLNFGFCSLIPAVIEPISEESKREKCVSFFEAMRKTTMKTPFNQKIDTVDVLVDNLTSFYVRELVKAIKINAVAAAVVFGLDMALTKSLSELNIDERYLPVIFKLHYRIIFKFRNERKLTRGSGKVDAIVLELINSTMKRKFKDVREKLCEKLLGVNKLDIACNFLLNVRCFNVEFLVEEMTKLNISPFCAKNLLSLYGNSFGNYCKSLMRQKYSKIKRHKEYVIRNSKTRNNLKKYCQILILRTLIGRYNVEDVIIVFLTSAIMSLNICHVNEELWGDMIAFLEKQMHSLLVERVSES